MAVKNREGRERCQKLKKFADLQEGQAAATKSKVPMIAYVCPCCRFVHLEFKKQRIYR